jgi:ElaB/YqjD/DUF883 family membrane-anchored ribosome-binding protein
MLDQRLLLQKWSAIKDKLQQSWGELTDDDLVLFRGTVDEFVELIQRKTGQANETIQQQLKTIAEEFVSLTRQAADTVGQSKVVAQQAIDEAGAPILDSLNDVYRKAKIYVRRHPGESVAICLAVGVLAGLALSGTRPRS